MANDVLYQEVGMVTTKDELKKIQRRVTANLILTLFHFVVFLTLLSLIAVGVYTYYPHFQQIISLSDQIESEIGSLSSTINTITNVAGKIMPIVDDVQGCIPFLKSYCGDASGSSIFGMEGNTSVSVRSY
jgi:hypothetical protein